MSQSRTLSGSGRPRNTDNSGNSSVYPLLTINNAAFPPRAHTSSPRSAHSSPERPGSADPDRRQDNYSHNSQTRQSATGSDYSNVETPHHRVRPSQIPTGQSNGVNHVVALKSEVIVSGSGSLPDTGPIRTSEHTVVDRKDLRTWDVASLIINKQIGTGIYTTPGLVLKLTGSKKIALGLWVVGGIWALVSVVIYVEFGVAFPFNGGELVYVSCQHHSAENLMLKSTLSA